MAPFACIGFKGFYHPLRNYPLEVVPSTLVMIADVYHARLWCGLCGDFAVTDLFVVVSAGTCFWFCCHWHAVPCGFDDHFAQTLSFCMCPFGTLAVDAPLAGCKRTVWASLGPTHRYFIDVWQQGQWANAPAGDWSCLSPEKERRVAVG